MITIFNHMKMPAAPYCAYYTRAIFHFQTGPTNYGLPLQPYVISHFKTN
jgi:hypothetical protein